MEIMEKLKADREAQLAERSMRKRMVRSDVGVQGQGFRA